MRMQRVIVGALLCAAFNAASAGSLLEATRAEQPAAAVALIEQHADVNERASDGTTALHWAAHNRDLDLVKRLIKAGANVKSANDYGATPMSEAADLGEAAILEALLAAGADVESPNAQGETALMSVARTNHVDAAQVLLKHKANVNAVEIGRASGRERAK